MKSKRAFTLMEMVIAVTLLGILAVGIGVPLMNGIVENGERRVAIARAEAIWAGQQMYLKRVSNAESIWGSLLVDESKFGLIRDFTPGASGLTLSEYQKYDYEYSFGSSLNTRPTITDPDGNSVSY